MKKSLRIALAVAVLASVTPTLTAAPTNPWPTPVPRAFTSAVKAPTNPWPTPVPHSLNTIISMLLSAFGL